MDYHTFSWGDRARLEETFRAVVTGPFDVAMLVLDFPLAEAPAAWWTACEAFAAAVETPGLVVATLPETMSEAALARIRELGLIPMLGVAETIAAIAALGGAAAPAGTTLHAAGRPVPAAVRTLDEAASKELLASAGVAIPAGRISARPLEEPVAYPVTVKVLGIDHKADAGAVAVGITDEPALRDTVAAMPVGERYLLEETIIGGIAELLLSVRTVDGLGWMLTIGAGGSLVEAFDDHAHLLVPATPAEVLAAVRSLRVAATLRRRRAGPEGDVAGVVDAAMALQTLATSEVRLVEVEVNPLIVTDGGALAADAMVTLAES